MTQDEKDIRSACQAYGKAMQAMDLGALQRLWDSDHAHLIYQPEEYARACQNWDEIVAYWSYVPKVIEHIPEWREIESDVAVVGDAALVYAVVSTTFHFKEARMEPLRGEVRFSFGLIRTPERWRFVHCHESRQLAVDGAGE